MWLLALIPVCSFLFLFEVSIRQANLSSITNWIIDTHEANPSYIIYYISSAALHTIVCAFFTLQFFRSPIAVISKEKEIGIKLHALIASLLIICCFIIIVTAFDTYLERLSHHVIYASLIGNAFFVNFFSCVLGSVSAGVCTGIYAFSFIPMFLVTIGHLATVIVIFDIGAKLCELDKVADEKLWKERANFAINLFREKFYALSTILFTSSICATHYFLLPLSVITDEKSSISYRAFASSMSISWGIIFSLTLCAILVFPYLRYRARIYEISKLRRANEPDSTDDLIYVND